MYYKPTIFDYSSAVSFRIYLDSIGIHGTEQQQMIHKLLFDFARIAMIIGFLIGLFIGGWIL